MSSHTESYPVPFLIDRTRAPHLYRLVNVGDESVRGVRATLLGSGVLLPVQAPLLPPGQALTLTVLGFDLSRSTVVVIRWFRLDDTEYLWRFSF